MMMVNVIDDRNVSRVTKHSKLCNTNYDRFYLQLCSRGTFHQEKRVKLSYSGPRYVNLRYLRSATPYLGT
eukprot:SAG31_NODE_1024_length_10294_cov_7.215400_8_plen_70_part_00